MTAITDDDDVAVAWCVFSALQNPVQATFPQLRRVDRRLPLLDVGADVPLEPSTRMVFEIYPMLHRTEDEVPIDGNGGLFVVTHLRFGFGGLFTDSDVEPFEFFVLREPEPCPPGARVREPARRERAPSSSLTEQLYESFLSSHQKISKGHSLRPAEAMDI